jgi:pimeloyl-ACP methyl ester carboxylesterase
MLPERVLAGIVLAGVTDMGWPGAWENYVDSECQIMRLADEEAAIAWCVERYGVDGSEFLAASDFDFGEPDNALIEDEQAGPALTSAISEAFRQGVAGYALDIFIQGRPWPFDPGVVSAPVHVVHGELDKLIPLAHSHHTSEEVRGSILRVLPGHGHLTIVSELPAIASALSR